jgi:hypothetical protein
VIIISYWNRIKAIVDSGGDPMPRIEDIAKDYGFHFSEVFIDYSYVKSCRSVADDLQTSLAYNTYINFEAISC